QIPNPSLEDTGLPQQVEIVERVQGRSGKAPIVVDARDVLENPRAALTRLCAALDTPFDDAMLSWPAGPRDTDGVWAPHWYAAVNASTGFEPYRPKDERVPPRLTSVLSQCMRHYESLHAQRLR